MSKSSTVSTFCQFRPLLSSQEASIVSVRLSRENLGDDRRHAVQDGMYVSGLPLIMLDPEV